MSTKQLAVCMTGIVKKYGDFLANDHINFEAYTGEIHALLGENGSGKTTLMSILYGLKKQTEGSIQLFGHDVHLTSPNMAIAHGVAMVHQHFMLVPTFSVLENIVLGHEPMKKLGQVDYAEAAQVIIQLMDRYQLQVDLSAKVADISVSMQQRVEILKALYLGANIFILDEPTAALTPDEIQGLLDVIRRFKAQGATVIIVTHKLKEIKAIADRCTILRRGQVIDCVDVASTTEQQLADKMVGRHVSFARDKGKQNLGPVLLDVKNVCAKDFRQLPVLDQLSLQVRAGEIVGIAGVDGNGMNELGLLLGGLYHADSGSVLVGEVDILNATPQMVMQAGLSNIPADRHKHGLVLDFSIDENLALKTVDEQFSEHGFLQKEKMYQHALQKIKEFDIRCSNGPASLARSLSGGNQQKVIIAREVATAQHVLMAINPTRGLDVGAIEFIHQTLIDQRNAGKAVLLISFELDEILALSDRILVMFQGRVVGEVEQSKATERRLGVLMAGGRYEE